MAGEVVYIHKKASCIYSKVSIFTYRILGNFQGTKFSRFGHFKVFANKFSRMAIKARSDHVHTFNF